IVIGDVRVAGLGDAVGVVGDRPHRRRADIERDVAHQAAASSTAYGSSTRNDAPAPGADRTEMLPPCASAIAREITRPRPVPGIACSVAVDERKKRWKTRACSDSGMPMPVSVTSITTLAPSTRVRAVTVPAAGVN